MGRRTATMTREGGCAMGKTLGEQLRWLRQKKGLSLDQLASAAGISRAYLWKLERTPDVNPSIDLLEKLAAALEVAVTELVGGLATARGAAAVDVPPELLACKKRLKLADEDVQDLARIRFRGRRPTTANEWALLYMSLNQVVGDTEGEKR